MGCGFRGRSFQVLTLAKGRIAGYFYRSDIPEIINIQPKGSQAKPYQIKQVRNIIVKYQLEAPNE
ncbi:hypothetical protein FACS1894110_06380 [Spirochaetia bacterium]|nr:hypothetical protein FACS1894110_06380 [Spirochaetia bacterium]